MNLSRSILNRLFNGVSALLLLTVALLLLPAMGYAQTSDSTTVDASDPVADDEMNQNEEQGIIHFDPTREAQVQKRYRPTENDTAFYNNFSGRHWWKRIYAGAGVSYNGITDFNKKTDVTYFTAHLGYRFSPIHSLQLSLGTPIFKLPDGGKKLSLKATVDYAANLSNFIRGYNPKRVADVSTVLGVGFIYSRGGLPHRITPYGWTGLHFNYHASSSVGLFAEPWVGVSGDMSSLFAENNPSRYNLHYGVNAGLNIMIGEGYSNVAAGPFGGRFFMDVSTGFASTGPSQNFFKRGGCSYSGAVGLWFNRYLGMRLSANGQQGYTGLTRYNYKSYSALELDEQSFFSGGLEVMFDPLTVSKKWYAKDNRWFDLNLLVGMQMGYHIKATRETTNGSIYRKRFVGFTTALQTHFRPYPHTDKNTTVFFEPRYTLAAYRIPYVNTSNYYHGMEHLFTFSLGTRIYSSTKEEHQQTKAEGYNTFTPHWWTGLDLGMVKWARGRFFEAGPLGDINPTVTASVGYDLKPLASFRTQLAWQGLYWKQGVESKRYDVIDLRLAYMLNLNNLWQHYDSRRHFNTYLTTGPVFSAVLGDINKIAPAVNASFLLSWRASHRFDITAEGMGQWTFRKNVYPGTHARLNRAKYGVSIGTRYHFEDMDELKNNVSLERKDWQKGWFAEAGYGWALPLGTGISVKNASGTSWNINIGHWFLPMLGIRLGGNFQHTYWQEQSSENYTTYKDLPVANLRAEVLVNLLQLSREMRQNERFDNWELDFTTGLLLGGDKHAGSTFSQSHFHKGYTAGLQALYRVSQGAWVYVEPQYNLISYSTTEKGESGNRLDHFMNLYVGSRFLLPTKTARALLDDYESEFTPHWWTGISFGGTKTPTCTKIVTGSGSFNPTVGLNLGYDFTHLHTLRVEAQWARQNLSTISGSQPVENVFSQWNFRSWYMLNLTSLGRPKNYSPRFNIYLEAAPGLSHIAKRNKTAFTLSAGIFMSYRVKNNFDVIIESNGQYAFNSSFKPSVHHPKLSQIDVGLNIGTRYHFNPGWNDTGIFSDLDLDPWEDGWFFELSHGLLMPLNSGSAKHGLGTSWSMAAGHWFNKFVGVRMGGSLQQDYWHTKQTAAKFEPISGQQTHAALSQSSLQTTLVTRFEALINPLNLFNRFKNTTEAKPFELNIGLGMELGADAKAGVTAGNSRVHFVKGFTVSLDALYRIDKNTQFFLEPRYTIHGYRVNVVDLNSTERVSDRAFTVSMGARLQRGTKDSRKDVLDESQNPEHKGWWTAIDFGATRALFATKVSAGGTNFNPAVNFTGGYDFTRLHSVALQLGWNTLTGTLTNETYQVTTGGMLRTYSGTQNLRYHEVDIRMLYLFNIANLWTGCKTRQKFNIYALLGPTFTFCPSATYSLADGELTGGENFTHLGTGMSGKYSFGVNAGILTTLRLSDHWDIMLQSSGQCSPAMRIPGVPHSLLNCIKPTLSIGTRLHF